MSRKLKFRIWKMAGRAMNLKDIKIMVKGIEYYANALGGAYEKLWDSYIEVSQERDELLERVKELEMKNERIKG